MPPFTAYPENVHRRVIPAERLADPLPQLFVGRPLLHRGRLLQERGDDLAVLVVLEADDAGMRDGDVLAEALFDLEGVYVFTAWDGG